MPKLLATATDTGDLYARFGAVTQVTVGAVSGAPGLLFGTDNDTNLYRSGTNTLKTDDAMIALRYATSGYINFTDIAVAGSTIVYCNVTGEGNYRFRMFANGEMTWGDGTNSPDTNLYRSAANLLRTADDFQARRLSANAGPSDAALLNLAGTHPGAATSVYGLYGVYTVPSTATADSYGLYVQTPTTAAAAFTATALYGLRVGNAAAPGAGSTITTACAALFNAQTRGTNNYTLQVQSSSTATLWLAPNEDGTTPNAGILFGSSSDTNLYRSGANLLKTDDSLIVAGSLTGSGYDLIAPARSLEDTKEPSGFVDRTSSTISLVDAGATYTFTIAPTGASFKVWVLGVLQTKTTESLTIAKVLGTTFIYYNAAGTLTQSTTPWDLLTHVPIALVYYSPTAGAAILTEERHGCVMDSNTHYVMHTTRGAQLGTGLALGNYLVAPGSPTNAGNRWSLSSGTILDEDITHSLPGLAAGGPYTILRRTGANEFTWSSEADPYRSTGGNITYNSQSGGVWSETAITQNSRWVNYWVFSWGSTSATTQTFILEGQVLHTSLSAAQAETIESLDISTYPFIECVARYQVTFRRDGAYNTTGDARIDSVTQLFGKSLAIAGQTSASNHATLSNRYLADQHPASAVTNVPAGTIAATDIQSAINELDAEKVPTVGVYAASTTDLLTSSVTGDANARLILNADGALEWGGGSGALDTTLYRSGADVLTTDDSFVVGANSRTAGVAAIGTATQSDTFLNITGTNPSAGLSSYGIYGHWTGSSASTTRTIGIRLQMATAAAAYTTASLQGLWIEAPSIGAGSAATNVYGINVAAQTGGATASYGIAVGAATTQTLWLSSNADNTTAAAGIAFGLSSDTNLYRSAANTLKTDDDFVVGSDFYTTGFQRKPKIKSTDGAFKSYLSVISDTGSDAGAWVIHAPVLRSTSCMFRMRVYGFDYNTARNIDFTIVGYVYTGNNGSVDGLPGAVRNYSLNDQGSDGLKKWVGIDAAGQLAVAIGDETSTTASRRLNVDFDDIHPRSDDYSTGWSIDHSLVAGFGWLDIHGPLSSILNNTIQTAPGSGIAAAVGAAPSTDRLFYVIGTPTSTGNAHYGQYVALVGGSTATNTTSGIYVKVQTAAASYNVSSLIGVQVVTPTYGAGSTVSTAYGLYVGAQANAAVTSAFGIYAAGTSDKNYLGGTLQVGKQVAIGSTVNDNFLVNVAGTHPGAGTSVYGMVVQPTAPSTATTGVYGLYAQARTAAAAFTVSNVVGLYVDAPTKGAGSAMTTVTGLSVYPQTGGATNVSVAIGAASGGATANYTLLVSSNANSTTAAGGITFGSSFDTNLYRGAANQLTTDDFFVSVRAASGDNALGVGVVGDTSTRFHVFASGEVRWGPGDNTWDTNLYRSAANTLKTDDSFIVGGDLTVTGSFTAPSYAPSTLTLAGAAPQVTLNNATSNWVQWNTNGTAAPTFTTRSPGTKLVLYPVVDASNVDYGVGVESGFAWFSTPRALSTFGFRWYGGTTQAMSLTGDGILSLGAIPATAGNIRVINGATLYYRNADNTANNAGLQFRDDYTAIFNPAQFIVNIGGANPLIVTNIVKASTAYAVGTNPASVGTIRMPSGGSVYFRDSGNTADPVSITNNTSDQLVFNSTNTSTGAFVFNMNGVTQASVNSAALAVTNCIRIGSNYAASGVLRIGSAAWLTSRNNANNGDVNLIRANASDQVELGAALKLSGASGTLGSATGWGTPTGTLTRATYATSTATLTEVAERLAALISDLKSEGVIGG